MPPDDSLTTLDGRQHLIKDDLKNENDINNKNDLKTKTTSKNGPPIQKFSAPPLSLKINLKFFLITFPHDNNNSTDVKPEMMPGASKPEMKFHMMNIIYDLAMTRFYDHLVCIIWGSEGKGAHTVGCEGVAVLVSVLYFYLYF